MMVLEAPTILRLPTSVSVVDYRRALTFKNKAAFYQLQQFKKNRWFAQTNGQEAYEARLNELKALVDVCLLLEDDKGYYTYPGLRAKLQQEFKLEYRNDVIYPEPKLLAYDKTPDVSPRPYQTDAVEALLEVKHGGVEYATGAGKTLCIEMLCKALGLKTIIMAPSKSIAGQIYRQLSHRFGSKKVGMFGDGKRKTSKLITVGIAASLARVEPGSEAWEDLSKAQVLCSDECHQTPSATQEKVCSGVAANAPYRFFFSGTQLRNDGAGLLLDGITNTIVRRLSVRELVDQGYLSKPNFFMHRIQSKTAFSSRDYGDMVNVHVYRNAELAQYAAHLADQSVSVLGHKVLILIQHVEQFSFLLPFFKHEVGFAFGGLNKENKKYVDPRFHNSDPDELVESLNNGPLQILVGTSAVAQGTDFTSVGTIIYLMAGKSEIKVRQAVGRGTRKTATKNSVHIHDFFVALPDEAHDGRGLSVIERHALTRRDIYESIYPGVIWIGGQNPNAKDYDDDEEASS